MPAKSIKQRNLMALAEHDPDKVYSKNKGVLGMSKKQLSEFASTPTKGLPKKKNSVRALLDGDKNVIKNIIKSQTGGK